jgi:sugar lactone lactonase YvrE/serine/threonine protein kinase
MTAQVIDRDRLGSLTKIGQGGQGVVYRAPNAKTTFAASMVYKQYEAQVLAGIDFTALAAMPALVEESLSYAEAERLISIAAWPCAIVQDGGTPTGFVMPAIPEQFTIDLTTAKAATPTTAEFQHLLNHPSVLAARGITIDDVQRFTLLREVASGLAFLHKNGVCIGDISPKNLLFSLRPPEGVYFIDCDAMCINGTSTLPQVETPGWEIPSGEELATIYSDTYKLGLLALRLLAGDQDTKNPHHLPASTPGLLRQIITDTLTNGPHQRPLPEAWTYVLGHAIEETQHHKLTTPTHPAPASAAPAPPPLPTVHTRPPISPSAPPAPPPRPADRPPPATRTPTQRQWWLRVGIPAVLLTVAVFAAIVIIGQQHRNSNGPQHREPAYGPQVTLPFTGLNQPFGVAVDALGNLYVTDSGNNRVLRLAADSATQAVLPFTGLAGPVGVAVDPAGDLYVTDQGSNRVLELAAGSATPTVVTDLNQPIGVAVDAAGNLYVTDGETGRVRELAAGSSTQRVSPFTDLVAPRVAVDSAGDVYVTDEHSNRVLTLAAGSNTQAVLPFNGLYPTGVAVDAAGNLYVTDTGNNRVVKLPAG